MSSLISLLPHKYKRNCLKFKESRLLDNGSELCFFYCCTCLGSLGCSSNDVLWKIWTVKNKLLGMFKCKYSIFLQRKLPAIFENFVYDVYYCNWSRRFLQLLLLVSYIVARASDVRFSTVVVQWHCTSLEKKVECSTIFSKNNTRFCLLRSSKTVRSAIYYIKMPVNKIGTANTLKNFLVQVQ